MEKVKYKSFFELANVVKDSLKGKAFKYSIKETSEKLILTFPFTDVMQNYEPIAIQKGGTSHADWVRLSTFLQVCTKQKIPWKGFFDRDKDQTIIVFSLNL
jgi:hypothetical protein